MNFLQKLRKASLITATAMVPLLMPAQQGEKKDSYAPIEQRVVSEASYLEQVKQNQKIEYNGLFFDIPKLREIQKDKKSILSRFDFILEESEVGLSFQGSDNKKLLVLMEPEQLEDLIQMAIMKDRNPEEKAEVRPENPHLWKYVSHQPKLLAEKDGKRDLMTAEDHQELYDMGLEVIFELHKRGVIDLGEMMDKYAERIGGVTGAALQGAYKMTPNILLKKTIDKMFKDDILKGFASIPSIEARNREEFEKERQQFIEIYDAEQAEKDSRLAESKKRAQEKEQKRLASIIHIKGEDFYPEIEKNKLNGEISQVNLSFNEQQNRIVIMDYRVGQGNMDGCIYQPDSAGNWSVKAVQPEEWHDIQVVLNQKLTPEQKDDLGPEFFRKISQKVPQNTGALIAFAKRIDPREG